MNSPIFPLIITIIAFSWFLLQVLIIEPTLFGYDLMITVILTQVVWVIWLVLNRSK